MFNQTLHRIVFCFEWFIVAYRSWLSTQVVPYIIFCCIIFWTWMMNSWTTSTRCTINYYYYYSSSNFRIFMMRAEIIEMRTGNTVSMSPNKYEHFIKLLITSYHSTYTINCKNSLRNINDNIKYNIKRYHVVR